MSKRVVITGVGVVSPIGNGRESFFAGLAEGKNGIGPITVFNASTFPVRLAGEVKGDEVFAGPGDGEVYGFQDRKVLLGYRAAVEAILSAHLTGEDIKSLGVNTGVSLESVRLEDIAAIITGSGEARLQTPLDTLNRILLDRYGFQGPCYVNCSACTAGAQAIGHSFRKIRAGEASMMLAGGTDSMINPLGVGGFSLLGALSTATDPGCACRPFDRERSGTILGEGAAFVVMEELGRAKARGADIFGEIAGYGSSLDAYGVTDPHPGGEGAAKAMQGALKDAGLVPEQVDYINAHGTATPKNDLSETLAIKKVFGSKAYEIPVSSVKSMTGHLIAAAGAVEAVASLSAFAQNLIPPTINYKFRDPHCDLDYTPNRARAWYGEYIMSNSFGFGGQNASIILRRFNE